MVQEALRYGDIRIGILSEWQEEQPYVSPHDAALREELGDWGQTLYMQNGVRRQQAPHHIDGAAGTAQPHHPIERKVGAESSFSQEEVGNTNSTGSVRAGCFESTAA